VEKNKGRILIVDDYPNASSVLAEFINLESDLEVCAVAKNAREALASMEKQPVDLSVVDISLNGESGLELSEKIKSQWPNIHILIFSAHDELMYVKRAFQVGAEGYVIKSLGATKELLTAIRQVLAGEIYICKKIIKNFPKNSIDKILTENGRDSG
jgi:DNA-binding NarL/FixJ family response regulator